MFLDTLSGDQSVPQRYFASQYRHFLSLLYQSGVVFEVGEQQYAGLLDKWKENQRSEEKWAVRITEEFLYYGIEAPNPVEYILRKMLDEEFPEDRIVPEYTVLTSDEQSELRSIIDKDEDLHLYRLILEKREKDIHYERTLRFMGTKKSPYETFNKVHERLAFRLHHIPDPYDEIAEAICNEDYFTASLKLYELYVGSPFESETKAIEAIPQFLLGLLMVRRPLIVLDRIRLHKGKKLKEETKNYLDKSSIEALSAHYFYYLEEVRVWNQTFYRIKPHKERIEKLKNNPEEVKAEALRWAQEEHQKML